jgi:hypothetical protein
MAHINRTQGRSFSINIFHRNAQELLAATRNVRDPEEGLQLMAQDNREAGQQAHREINRFVHNFVASAMTLVEHTRNFMRKQYAGTDLKKEYDYQVKVTFASDPVIQFVQDLRDYMLHRALPQSEMFIKFDSGSKEPGGEPRLETGVRYEASALLEWDRWSGSARVYISSAGEHIDIHIFAERYLEKVLAFYQWLDVALNEFHANDLAKLGELQAAYAQHFAEPMGTPSPLGHLRTASEAPRNADIASIEQQFEFSNSVANFVDEAGNGILRKIRRLDFGPPPTGEFVSERPVQATITPETMLGTPILRGNDSAGRPVIAFITSGTEVFGLDASTFAELQPLEEKIFEVGWAKHALSRKFIEQTAIDWLRSAFLGAQTGGLSTALSSASRDQVKPRDFWAPIACLEVEERFAFGPAEIAPMTRAMFDQLEGNALRPAPKQRDDIIALFKDLRSRMQGLAAVVVHIEAEQTHASEEGMVIAENALGLLRFFSPVARMAWQVCSTGLLGTETVPRLQSLVLGEDDFLFSDGSVFSPFVWQLSKQNVSALWQSGLERASGLVLPNDLSEFQLSVRASLLLYSSSMTFRNTSDRLRYALSSVEGVLLKHSMEPVELSVEERMSLLLANDKSGREQVALNVREAYRYRKRGGTTVLSPRDQHSLAMFIHNAHVVLCTALENLHAFPTRADFVDAVERRKSISDAA